MANNKEFGYRGERAAAHYLKAAGYTIISNNYRCGHLEIDIIAIKDADLVFFEVKTRRATKSINDDIPISARQITNLKRAIQTYRLTEIIPSRSIKLDLIVITLEISGKAGLVHYRDIL